MKKAFTVCLAILVTTSLVRAVSAAYDFTDGSYAYLNHSYYDQPAKNLFAVYIYDLEAILPAQEKCLRYLIRRRLPMNLLCLV
jgi:hypothetical protein